MRSDMFIRKVDQTEIPACNIMGVHIAAIDMNWLLEYINHHIKELKGDYLCVSNVHTTVMAFEDDEYRAIQNNGLMAIPDGGPLVSVGKRRGYRNMRRTTGPDLMEEIFRISSHYGYRHYFYGASDETLGKLKLNLQTRYPDIQIAGMYSPPFRQMNDEEDTAAIHRINTAEPDFIWVGLGAPKQERWMAAHQGKMNGLMIGVGAGFDYLAGNLSRAPQWMQRMNLEWLYRLAQDPKRLFRRYFHANIQFIVHAVIRGQ